MIQPTTPTKAASDPEVAELQNRLGVPSASDRCNADASYRCGQLTSLSHNSMLLFIQYILLALFLHSDADNMTVAGPQRLRSATVIVSSLPAVLQLA